MAGETTPASARPPAEPRAARAAPSVRSARRTASTRAAHVLLSQRSEHDRTRARGFSAWVTGVMASPRAWGVTAVAVLVVVFALALASVRFTTPGSPVALWWPAGGLGVAFLLAGGPARGRATLFLAGIVVATGVANWVAGRPPAVALAFGVANASEAFVVHRLLTRRGRRAKLETPGDLGRLLGATAAGAACFGALAGVVVTVGLSGSFFPTSYAVAASHAAAVLIVAPIGLSLATPRLRPFGLEDVGQLTTVAIVTVWVFRPDQGLPLAFLPMPALAWVAMRQSLRPVSLQLMVVAVLAVVLTRQGGGPFATAAAMGHIRPEAVGALTQGFLVTAAVMTLALAVSSAQRRRTVELQQHQALFTSVVIDTVAAGIVVVDADGRVERVNTTAAAWFGRLEGDLVGTSAAALVSSTVPEAPGGAPAPVVLPGVAVEQVLSVPGQGPRTIVWTSTELVDERGRRSHVVVSGADVTDARHALEHERRLVEELTALDRTKNDFLSAVSHELRTPLANVMGYAEMLEDGAAGELTSHQRELVARIDRNGRRLLELIEDVLVNSHIEAGTLELDRRRCNLADVVTSAVTTVRPVAERRGLTLSVDAFTSPLWVSGDAAALERAAANVLGNAVKFTAEGGSVAVSLTRDAGAHPEARLVVRDTGIGIPSADLEKVFRRFYRSRAATDGAIQGTGLGLSIVQAVVEGHDGHVSVRSRPGHGTTFTVTVPALPAVPAGAEGAAR